MQNGHDNVLQDNSGCPFENFFTINNYLSTRKMDLKSINIIVTLMSGSILFLRESSMAGTPFQVPCSHPMYFCLRKDLMNSFVLTLPE